MIKKIVIVLFSLWLIASAQTDSSGIEKGKVGYQQQSKSDQLPFKPGDAVKITIYPDTSLFLNGFYKIDNNNYINLPMLGLISVKNKTKNEFIDFLKKEYADFLKYPNINIVPYMRISFFGGFYRPGLYWVENRNSMWDAMQLAGGVNRDDGLMMVRWERDGKILSYNIVKDFQSGKSLESIGFKSGDQLCVTSKPKQLFWESFRDEIVPVLSISLATLSTALTAYQTFKIYNNK